MDFILRSTASSFLPTSSARTGYEATISERSPQIADWFTKWRDADLAVAQDTPTSNIVITTSSLASEAYTSWKWESPTPIELLWFVHNASSGQQVHTRKITNRLSKLESEFDQLRAELSNLATNAAWTIHIGSLPANHIELVKELPVSLVSNGEDVVATSYDLLVSASGDTSEEAVDNLRDLIVSDFDLLSSMTDDELGAAMLRKRSMLLKLVKRVG